MSTPGRNDPCPCGSGKKYKQCHLEQDRELAGARAEVAREHRARLEAMGSPSEDELRMLYAELTGRRPSSDKVPEKVQGSLTDIWRQRRLSEQAVEALAGHRSEAEAALGEGDAEFEKVAGALARELDLSNYELTKANVRRSLLALGPPPQDEAAWRAYADAACRLVLDDEDRQAFRDGLLQHLPDLVADGRWTEAHVLETCAARTLDPNAEASAFLEDVVRRSVAKAG